MMNIVRRDNSPRALTRSRLADDQFGRFVENMFEDFFAPLALYPSPLSTSDFGDVISPRLNLSETDKTFEIEVEMPGVKKEDITVSIDKQRVLIEGEAKRESAQKEGENIVYAERATRRFSRSFTLPAEVDDAAAQARLENGILLLSLPKKEATQAKKLTIQ